MQHKESEGSGEEKGESRSSRNLADGVGNVTPTRGDKIAMWHQDEAPAGLSLPRPGGTLLAPGVTSPALPGSWSPCHSPAGTPRRAAGEEADGLAPSTAEARFCFLFCFLLGQTGWAEGGGCSQLMPGVSPKTSGSLLGEDPPRSQLYS